MKTFNVIYVNNCICSWLGKIFNCYPIPILLYIFKYSLTGNALLPTNCVDAIDPRKIYNDSSIIHENVVETIFCWKSLKHYTQIFIE